jgi:dihydroxyacetone kinase DhaKLM complex PTS-EIIA-like component DhaM
MRPDDPSYATTTGLQRRAADAPVVEGRITASQPEPENGDGEEAEVADKKKNGRRRRSASDDDDGEL